MWVWGQTPYVLLSLVNVQDSSCQSVHCSQREFPRGLRPHPSSGLVHSSFLHSAPSSSGAYKERLPVLNLSLNANSFESPSLHPQLQWDSSYCFSHTLFISCVRFSLAVVSLFSLSPTKGWGGGLFPSSYEVQPCLSPLKLNKGLTTSPLRSSCVPGLFF